MHLEVVSIIVADHSNILRILCNDNSMVTHFSTLIGGICSHVLTLNKK